jgi:hypothetical protein
LRKTLTGGIIFTYASCSLKGSLRIDAELCHSVAPLGAAYASLAEVSDQHEATLGATFHLQRVSLARTTAVQAVGP